MKKRLFTLIMMGIITASVLSACGGKLSAGTVAPAEVASEGEKTDATESGDKGESEAGDAGESVAEADGAASEGDSGADGAASEGESGQDLPEFEGELEVDLTEAVQRVYDTIKNFENGMMIEIFVPDVAAIYDNWDQVEAMNTMDKPIRLREYAETDIVYLDFDNGYSVKWDRVNDQAFATMEETSEDDVKDWEGREHK